MNNIALRTYSSHVLIIDGLKSIPCHWFYICMIKENKFSQKTCLQSTQFRLLSIINNILISIRILMMFYCSEEIFCLDELIKQNLYIVQLILLKKKPDTSFNILFSFKLFSFDSMSLGPKDLLSVFALINHITRFKRIFIEYRVVIQLDNREDINFLINK